MNHKGDQPPGQMIWGRLWYRLFDAQNLTGQGIEQLDLICPRFEQGLGPDEL